MPKYHVARPQPQPTVHKIEFTIDELVEALTNYAVKHDIVVPEGMINVWGLANDDCMQEQLITLVIRSE